MKQQIAKVSRLRRAMRPEKTLRLTLGDPLSLQRMTQTAHYLILIDANIIFDLVSRGETIGGI